MTVALGSWGSLSAQITVCPNSTVYLTVPSHRGNVQWESSTDGGVTWSSIPGATSDTSAVSVTDSMAYRAVITEGTCNPIYSDTSIVWVSNLQADAGLDKIYCAVPVTIGGSPAATGGMSPYTYTWAPGVGLSSSVLPNPQASPSAPTQYVLTVTDAMGCVAMDTVLVDTGAGVPGSDSTVFAFTGGAQTFVVPPCVDSVVIRSWGAQGENALVGGAVGGLGGYATGKLAVTVGETLYVYVGGQTGYNGGGTGGINGNSGGGGPIGTYGGNGGGASDVRKAGTALANRVIVAGGGGGAGHNGVWTGCQVSGPGGNGGVGGGVTGGTGGDGVGTPCNCAGGGGAGGLGGTQAAGGAYGAYAGNTACLRSSWGPGTNGQLGLGGNGSLLYHNGTGGGGGGGGGYYGGGAAGNGSDTTPGGGGGGGSSYTTGLTNGSTLSGIRTGNGRVVILF
ncbi:MAG TPA: glycine-rich protein [Bacteroidia bacterium]|nr:glycine-rich protein [Bacteroidia bacterium]